MMTILKMLQMIVLRLRQWSGKHFPPLMIGYHKMSTSKTFFTENDTRNVEIENEQKSIYSKNQLKIKEALEAEGYVNVHKIPTISLMRTNTIRYLHLIDETVAKNFASLIASDLSKKNSTVYEVNPGFGYLTEQLLEAGVARLHLFEAKSDYIPHLAPFIDRYPNRLSITNFDFLQLGRTAYVDVMASTNIMGHVMRHITKRKWNEEPSLYIVGALNHPRFLNFLRYSLISGNLSDMGRVGLYLAITPSFSLVFGDTKGKPCLHKPNNIFLQLLFNYEKLGTLPRRAFLPWAAEIHYTRRPKYLKEDSELVHVVKLVPKPDFFTDEFTKYDAEIFYYFLILHLRPAGRHVIQTLEKWVPNCGPRLIRMDFNIFTKFEELSALQLLNVFKVFKSWPEYKHSVFLSFVDDMKSRHIYSKIPWKFEANSQKRFMQ